MGLYTGIDLHLSDTYVGIIDEDGKRFIHKGFYCPQEAKGLWFLAYSNFSLLSS